MVLNDPDRFISEPDWAADPGRFIVGVLETRKIGTGARNTAV